ncbi:MAG: hypothetical protein HOM11_11190 [Methylococcales bacterium]|jgi:hypothetical protein|nr:hypothetical protein [Methylococcales bacterium]MBT7443389.1 hypothetical protein [Methylococcales bacterium]
MALLSAVKLWLALVVGGLILVVTLNIVADPLDVYRVVHAEGFNVIKPKVDSYSRLSKPMQVQRRQAKLLVMGSSRAEYGIPMTHSALGDSVYSYTMSGTNIYHTMRFFQHAVAQSEVKELVLGLDFFMFNSHAIEGLDAEDILAVTANNDINTAFKMNQWLKTLLSLDMFKISMKTLSRQKIKYQRFDELGNMTLKNITDYPTEFSHVQTVYAHKVWSECKGELFEFQRGDGSGDTFHYLQRILTLANDNNIKVTLYISGSHAYLWEMLDYMGLWSKFEDWKTQLSALADRYPEVPLWDFSGYHAYSVEVVPQNGEGGMQWYMDASHFLPRLGSKMLAQMFQQSSDGFGVLLNSGMMAAHLQGIREAQGIYRQGLPVAVKNAQKAIAQVAKKSHLDNGLVCH